MHSNISRPISARRGPFERSSRERTGDSQGLICVPKRGGDARAYEPRAASKCQDPLKYDVGDDPRFSNWPLSIRKDLHVLVMMGDGLYPVRAASEKSVC